VTDCTANRPEIGRNYRDDSPQDANKIKYPNQTRFSSQDRRNTAHQPRPYLPRSDVDEDLQSSGLPLEHLSTTA
jgi:hypothetical protein